MTTKFGVWCQVSGGVTGHRQAWLKSNGVRVEFATQEEAEVEAERLNAIPRPHAVATFRYRAMPLDAQS